jgi:hypothetical protein
MKRFNLFTRFAASLLLTTLAFAQSPDFVRVKAGSLRAGVETAHRQARASAPRARFWTAYSFNARAGVAVDSVPGVTGVVTGEVGAYETRNVGVFMLHEPETGTVERVEIFNLDRQRDFEGQKVYWLGHAASDESIGLLKSLVESSRRSEVAEQSVLAVALHEDSSVTQALRNFVQTSSLLGVRAAAVSWLGRTPGQLPFLADLVRDAREGAEIRQHAVMSIAKNRDADSFVTLQNLYASVAERGVKETIIRSAAKNVHRQAASDFLIQIAETDPDYELRERALSTLRKKMGRGRALK